MPIATALNCECNQIITFWCENGMVAKVPPHNKLWKGIKPFTMLLPSVIFSYSFNSFSCCYFLVVLSVDVKYHLDTLRNELIFCDGNCKCHICRSWYYLIVIAKSCCCCSCLSILSHFRIALPVVTDPTMATNSPSSN